MTFNSGMVAQSHDAMPLALPATLEGFRDYHHGATIVVCGCGRSLADFTAHDRFITIGVNDVGRLFQPTYLVVLNPAGQFSGDRFDYVARSGARALFTQLNLNVPHPHIVRFNLGQRNGVAFDTPNALPYTRNSPYVAMCLAALMGAKRIGLIGVDFTDDHFFGRTGKHPLTSQLAAIDQQYRHLDDALQARGVSVINLSRDSRLTAFRKGDINELGGADSISVSHVANGVHVKAAGGLKIVSYATTPVAGVPAILARCISATTPHTARCVWARKNYGNGVLFDGDVEWANARAEAEQLISDADLVIVHNGKVDSSHREILADKPIVTMAHNYMWNVDRNFVNAGFPGVVVGQYQATLPEFAGWSVVPNPVPLWESPYQPEPKPDVITIAYTPSGRHESFPVDHRLYWHGKGYDTTLRVLNRLLERHGIRLQAIGNGQISHADALAMKRHAHIVIDECVTGSYHRNSLEGLAAGCVVVNGVGLRPAIREMLQTCANGANSPFVFAHLGSLEEELEGLISLGAAALVQRGAVARQWMEQHWQFVTQWERYWKPVVDAALARSGERPMQRRNAAVDSNKKPVTIVIPHGGVERLDLLAATLKIAARSGCVAEIIVAEMDDVPHARNLAQSLGARYVFIRCDSGFNRARTINVGTALATTELVLWLDNDLLLPEEFLDTAITELRQRNLDCLIPWTSVRYLSADDSRAVIAGAQEAEKCQPANVYLTRRGACGGAVLLRRRLVQDCGGMSDAFRGWGGEDNAWFHKARVVGRAAITNRGDQHLHHLFHPLSGGYGSGEHIAANPHYQANVSLLYAMRRITDRRKFMASYPAPEHAPCPWDPHKAIIFVVRDSDGWAKDRLQQARAYLRELYGIDVGERRAGADFDADAAVVFGTASARRVARNGKPRAPCVVVHEDGADLPSLMSHRVSGDDARFAAALVSALSVVLGMHAPGSCQQNPGQGCAATWSAS
jgi:hypothetical protein